MHSADAEYEDFAILYRTNAQSRALEEQLRKRNIPYIIYSGNSFFERAEVKDMMAYFKLAANPRDDESFKRAVNKPARGIGDTSLQALAAAAQAHGTSLTEAAWAEDLESFGLKNAAIGKIRAFCSMIGKVAETLAETDAYTAAKALAGDSGLYAFYKSDNSIEGQARAANVQELLDSVAGYVEEEHGNYKNELIEDGKYSDPSDVPDSELPLITLPAFLENISLLSNVDVADDETSNKVALMTAHSAKGLEFPYVFVSGMEENLFPSGGWMLTEPELEEERRLFYVAITRAKKAVSLTYTQTRMRNGKHESNAPSRFLREIAPQYLQNPLRKEDFMTERVMDDDDHPGFRFGGFGAKREISPRAPLGRNDRPFKSQPTTLDAVRNRPLPPKVPDAEFTPDPMSSFRVGDRVEHNRFGVGKVLDISGEVPDIKAKVAFENYGEKILLLKYAKIRHLPL
jgi:DNA helicase-2/ATP-dependent DNA helicase PcrA